MNPDTLILISCFILSLAVDWAHYWVVNADSHDNNEDILAEEAAAVSFLLPTEDVNIVLNTFNSLHGFSTSWMVYPDGNGTSKIAIIKDDEDEKKQLPWPFQNNEEEAFEKVKFKLYNKKHPEGVAFGINDVENLDFNKRNGLKIISHGWRSNGDSAVVLLIKDAYLAEFDYNVIGVDWSYGAQNIMYNPCVEKTPYVGKVVGTLINKLVHDFDVNFEDVHIIGHSLGAHIAGFAGRATEKKVGRVTGLDPALPGFQYLELVGGRLNKSDALFVDVIHSCASCLGMSVPVGHVDFYPNGGTPFQPGCPDILAIEFPRTLETIACSHSRSYQFFAESIKKNSDFRAVKCDTWAKFESHECSKETTKMGDQVDHNVTGIFYLKTEDHTPFYLGMIGTVF